MYRLTDVSLEPECDSASTFRKGQKCNPAMPTRSSMLSPSKSATEPMPLPTAGQPFQQATQAHPRGLYATEVGRDIGPVGTQILSKIAHLFHQVPRRLAAEEPDHRH